MEGVRVPDDSSDALTYRNGRFINNIFVPADAPLPAETVVTSGDDKKLVRSGKSLNDGQVSSLKHPLILILGVSTAERWHSLYPLGCHGFKSRLAHLIVVS